MIRRAFKFRLYPTNLQLSQIRFTLDSCRELYNSCIQERRDAYQKSKISISLYEQQNQLPEVKSVRPEFKSIYAQVLQNVTSRVDKAFKLFFRSKFWYPRFRSQKRYSSFTYPQISSKSYTPLQINLPKIGWIRWKPWKDLDKIGKPKTLTIKSEADGFYAILACELPDQIPLSKTGNQIGIDLGLIHLIATSTGIFLGDLDILKRAEKALRRIQRSVSRKKKGSNRRRKAAQLLAKRHLHLTRVRKYQLDCVSKKLVSENDLIVMEDLNVKGMCRSLNRGMRRNLHQASFSLLMSMISYKAESAGREFIKVDPRYTSQTCPSCGCVKRKELSERTHKCDSCGLVLDRDVASAKVILQRGLSESYVEGCLKLELPVKREKLGVGQASIGA